MLAAYEEALKLEPDSAHAVGNVARILRMQGRTEGAVALLRRALYSNGARYLCFHVLYLMSGFCS